MLETALDTGFVEQSFDAMMNLEPKGVLCILGIQYMDGRALSLSVT